jgi:hypothetical protein
MLAYARVSRPPDSLVDMKVNEHPKNIFDGIARATSVPVNGFSQAKDGRWMCFNGASPHLRDG